MRLHLNTDDVKPEFLKRNTAGALTGLTTTDGRVDFNILTDKAKTAVKVVGEGVFFWRSDSPFGDKVFPPK